jgi:hypothetical protein
MDNATFHKGGRIEELIQSVGCRLLYLPPYSPDLNRIEQRRVLAGESHPQTIRSGEIVYVLATLGCPTPCLRRRRKRLLYINYQNKR